MGPIAGLDTVVASRKIPASAGAPVILSIRLIDLRI
jgi:hypothetical protein